MKDREHMHPEEEPNPLAMSLLRKVSSLLSGLLVAVCIIILGLFILIYSGIGVAHILSRHTAPEYSFFMVAGMYALILGIVVLFRKRIFEMPLLSLLLGFIFRKRSRD